MVYIPIAINNKVASVPCGTYIVADNTDYVLSFTFDAEWNGYPQKTARILIGSQYSDLDFAGNIVTLPPITSSAASILVGVYSDGIATTTPATVQVFASVLGSTGTEYEPVDPTVLPDAPEVAADDTITITDVSEGARAKATIGQIADVVAPLIPEQAARFEVTYNETPFASILAAYNNNKVVVLTMSDNEIPLHSISSTKAIFVGFNPEDGGTNAEKISVTSSNVWSYSVFDYYTTEDVDAAVASLTATDTALSGRIATIEGKEAGWNAKWGSGTIGQIPITALESTAQILIMRGSQAGADAASALAGLENKVDKTQTVTVSGGGDVTQALDAGKIYVFTGALTSLTLTFNAPASGDLAQYHFIFTAGSTAPTLTLPSGVTMPDNWEVEADKRYEVDVLDGNGVAVSWAVTV